MKGFLKDLRFEFIILIRKQANLIRKIVIYFHETKRNKTVKPCIGKLLYYILIAISDDEIDNVCARVEEYRKEARQYDRFPSTVVVNGKKQRYQLACTYYDACGSDDKAYLLARAVQFFAPGIPQVYYVGMLAGRNDIEALRRGEERRSINRHQYSENEIREACSRDVVKTLLVLMRFRNECPAFDGDFMTEEGPEEGQMSITRNGKGVRAVLKADFKARNFVITEEDASGVKKEIYRQ